LWEIQAVKRVIVPIEGATNVTLFGEHYDVINGKIEVTNGTAKKVLATPDLQEAAAHGKKWVVEDVTEK
jgi:hypothetical protein